MSRLRDSTRGTGGGGEPAVLGTPGGAVNGSLEDAANGSLEEEVMEVGACPPRLLNNMAVLLLQAGDSQRARELMAGAMAVRMHLSCTMAQQ